MAAESEEDCLGPSALRPKIASTVQAVLCNCSHRLSAQTVLILTSHSADGKKMDKDEGQARNGTLFESLHSDVFVHILGFRRMTQPTIRLFLTGSPIVRHMICRSATTMTFKSYLELDFSLLPSMLGNLANLRALTVICKHSPLVNPAHTRSVLESLSPTLEKLTLRMTGAGQLFDPTSRALFDAVPKDQDESDSRDSGTPPQPIIDLGKRFPKLKSLKLLEVDDIDSCTLKCLPHSLTRLVFGFTIHEKTETFAFPPNLLHLKVHASDFLPQSFWDALPQGLETLNLHHIATSDGLTIESAKALPRSLKRLVLPRNPHIGLTSDIVAALPPQLESIANVHHSIFNHFPGNLTEVDTGRHHLALTPLALRQLPRTITSLCSGLKGETQLGVGDFLPLLRKLDISLNGEALSDNLGCLLPSNHLHTLELQAKNMNIVLISQLPATLTRLSVAAPFIKVEETDVLQLPPLLTFCAITSQKLSKVALKIARMPDSLTRVQLSLATDLSTLFMLPPLLSGFEVNDVPNFLDFDPNDPVTIERILHVRNEAARAGFIFDEPLSPSTDRAYALFDILPRTLKWLSFGRAFSLEKLASTAWRSIPPNLKYFEIWNWNDDFPADFLDFLPYENVTKCLALPRAAVRDEHIKRLNPQLREIFDPLAEHGHRWELTSACVPWIPRGIPHWFIRPEYVENVYVDLRAQRMDCLRRCDREGFRALLPTTRD